MHNSNVFRNVFANTLRPCAPPDVQSLALRQLMQLRQLTIPRAVRCLDGMEAERDALESALR